MKVTSGALLATTLAAAGGQAVESTGTTTAHPCTTGTPVVSYGYTISYALVTPTVEAQLREGYEPDPSWSSAHLLGTETYGVPQPPVESGMAFAEMKCSYKCNSWSAGSFFLKYAGPGNQNGSYCSCFSDLITPDIYVLGNETMANGWNALCR